MAKVRTAKTKAKARAKAKPVGRPTKYSKEVALRVCTRLIEGESLVAICSDENEPAVRTIYYWLESNPDFLHMYEAAKSDQADTMAEQIMSIADSANASNVQVARLQVDARKWVAAKLKPKKYGDKLGIGGDDSMPPIKVSRIELVALGPRRDNSKS